MIALLSILVQILHVFAESLHDLSNSLKGDSHGVVID